MKHTQINHHNIFSFTLMFLVYALIIAGCSKSIPGDGSRGKDLSSSSENQAIAIKQTETKTGDFSNLESDDPSDGKYRQADEVSGNWTTANHIDRSPEVVKMIISSGVKNRIPFDDLSIVPVSLGKIFTFTAVRSDEETAIDHVYKFDGKEVARVTVNIGISDYWRTWTSKLIDQRRLGKWSVEIQSENGEILSSKTFTVVSGNVIGEKTKDLTDNDEDLDTGDH